jgi:glucokinase
MGQKVLSYDLGGTKVAVGIVDDKGRVLEEIRVPVVLEEGKEAVFKQLTELGTQFLKRFPDVKKIGIASAGPLDPEKGILLDPTNFASVKGTWGKTPIAQLISKKLKTPCFLENDAAAAVMAEHWVGAGKKYKNVMVLTLGTGLGTGIICNGNLVRSGRNLHPEAGHLIIRANDSSAPCGCGNLGCAEAFLSGRNFSRRARQRFANPNMTAVDIADFARKHDPRALAAFDEYADLMANAIHNYVRIYSPEIVIFTGSFAAASDLFLEKTQKHLEHLLVRQREGIDMMPKLAISTLENDAGLIGGAYVAFHRKTEKMARRKLGKPVPKRPARASRSKK